MIKSKFFLSFLMGFGVFFLSGCQSKPVQTINSVEAQPKIALTGNQAVLLKEHQFVPDKIYPEIGRDVFTVSLVSGKENLREILPLQNFDGAWVYLLSENELIYTANFEKTHLLRKYSLAAKTDELIADFPSEVEEFSGSFVVEKFDANKNVLQALMGNSENGVWRFVIDLKDKKFKSADHHVGYFCECIEDPDGSCGKKCSEDINSYKTFVEKGGLKMEVVDAYPMDLKPEYFDLTAPTCKDFSSGLTKFELFDLKIVGCTKK